MRVVAADIAVMVNAISSQVECVNGISKTQIIATADNSILTIGTAVIVASLMVRIYLVDSCFTCIVGTEIQYRPHFLSVSQVMATIYG